MKRRDFVADFSLGYSLVVLADRLPAAPPPIPEEIGRQFERAAPPRRLSAVVPADPHMTLVDLSCDVLVAGGGLAGVCAALAAARHGAQVILVQDRSRLGGNSSSEVKMHVVGASASGHHAGWREGGIVDELRVEDAVRNPQRSFEMWDLLLYDKIVSEPRILLLLDTAVYAAECQGGRIHRVMARSDRTEHLYRIQAKLYCDCTGDWRLGLESGAEMRTGRESRAEFGESLAMEAPDQHTLGSSILFTSRLYPRRMPFQAPSWARKVTKEHLRFRGVSSWEYGYWWIEWGGDRDPIRQNERIRFELLSIVMGVWDYIKNSGEHRDSDYYALDWVGMLPGKRGGRRLMGDHVLTQHDIEGGGRFPDAVAIGGWPMDDHPPQGFDRPELKPARQIQSPSAYNIPLRCCYSRNVAHLFMAGRNISASHVAFTSTRVMATCGVVGQAVGTAAALCAARGLLPAELARDPRLVARLQQMLLRDDQTLRGPVNQDPEDLARQARVTASSAEGAPPENVLDGEVRDIPHGKIHRWSAPLGEQGAWIQLAWDQPRTVREAQLTFDTGFQRELTLTAQNSYHQKMIRGPQPETVRDFVILVRETPQEPWRSVAKIRGNYQRLRRVPVSAEQIRELRVLVQATHGDPLARIFEIRCYA